MNPQKRFSLCLLIVTVPFLLYQLWSFTFQETPKSPKTSQEDIIHPKPNALIPRKNIWSDLTREEATHVLQWLHGPKSGINLTAPEKAGPFDDFVLVTEILRPNKTEAAAFLSGKQSCPPRFARVTVKRNSVDPQDIAEYTVGPLSDSAEPRLEPLKFMYNSARSTTANPAANIAALSAWIDKVASDVEDIVQDLLGRPVESLEDAPPIELEASSHDQVSMENGRTMRWVTFYPVSDAPTLLPQGLYFKADTTGSDPAAWKVVSWSYNGITYESTEDFRRAWESSDFETSERNLDGTWTHLDPELPPVSAEYSTNAPPQVVQPGPSRISIDKNESFVAWMGFTFNFAFSQVNGIALYDLRVDGERVMYELSLQEAMAHYAGNDPFQSSTAFLDSLYGIGTQTGELLPGYDCPEYAHFLDLSYHRMEKTHFRKGALCIFEMPSDHPLQRHSRGGTYTSFTNSVLIIRTITVVGNYDYLVDYIMYLDGSIEVKIRASGYIQGAFYLNNTGYGYRVHDALSSSIHDHVINFKADLDIADGAKNSLTKMTVAAKDVEYPWLPTGPRHTMMLEREVLQHETALNWPPNSASMYVITGPPNHLGERRGYRVMPGTGVGTPSHLTVKNSSILIRSAEWATHDLFVTKQKDTEPRSSVPANALDPADPLVDFGKFLDGEDIVEEDLVVWFNLGGHHVPHTGDIPNTLMTTSASSVMFTPHNYHVRDRSRALTNGVRVDTVEGGGYKARFFGAGNGSLGAFAPSPRSVRKLPTNDTGLAL